MLTPTRVVHSHIDGDDHPPTLHVDIRIECKWQVPTDFVLRYVNEAVRQWEEKLPELNRTLS